MNIFANFTYIYLKCIYLHNTVPASVPIDESTPPPLTISEHEVRRCFQRVKVNKAAGPDAIKPRLLKLCSSELAPIFTFIFNWSLELCTVPSCFKKSVIIPVPKKSSPQCMNDYRPVALTSVIMKCFEKIVLNFINALLPKNFDTFQFAYRPQRNIDDAIAINIHEILNHCESKNTYARVLFIDYSSAFNTIVPAQLYSKLLNELNFPHSLCNWILNFLLNRPQVVKIGNKLSSTLILNTGTPQGCPISPKLYSIFTFDCKSIYPKNLVIKFADDTTVTGLITDNDENNYRSEIENIVDWCSKNNLLLNVKKTKEMIVDFRRNKNPIHPIFINNEPVEQISNFKFLGTTVTCDLSWTVNCSQILKKAKQRMYFLRQLRSYNVNSTILLNFYRSIIESILSSSITVWFDKATQHDLLKLVNVTKQAAKIIGCDLPSLEDIYIQRLSRKTNVILNDSSHPAIKYFNLLPSGRRMRHFKGNVRFLNSTYPQAVKIFNNIRNNRF